MRKKSLRKSATAIVAILASGAMLASCSANSTTSASQTPGSTNSSVKGQTISVLLVDQPTTQDMVKNWIPKFEKSSGVTVNVTSIPESGLPAKLAAAVSKNQSQYDVVMTGVSYSPPLITSGSLMPLDKLFANTSMTPKSYSSGFNPQLLKNIKVNNKTYMMPFQVGGDMLFYNKELFKKAGLDPSNPPRTMAAVVADASKIKAATPDVIPYVGRGTRAANSNSFQWIMMWLADGGGWVDSAGKTKYDVLTDPPAIKATTQYDELMTKYGPPGPTTYDFSQAQQAMQQGKAAMWIDAAQLGPSLTDPNQSAVAKDIGFAALKAPSSTNKTYITGAVWGLGIPTAAKHANAAWDFVTYMTGKDVTVAEAINGSNGSPARTDAMQDPAVKKALGSGFLDALADTVPYANPYYSPLIPQGAQIRADLALNLSNMLSGSASPTDTMTTTNNQVKQLLGIK